MPPPQSNEPGKPPIPTISEIALAKTGMEREGLIECLDQEIERLRRTTPPRHRASTPEQLSDHLEGAAARREVTRLKKIAEHVYSGKTSSFPAGLVLSQAEVEEMVLTLREHREQFWLSLFTIPAVQVARIRELRSLLEKDGGHYKRQCFFTKRGEFSDENIMREIEEVVRNIDKLVEGDVDVLVDPSTRLAPGVLHRKVAEQLIRVPLKPDVALEYAAESERVWRELMELKVGVWEEDLLEVGGRPTVDEPEAQLCIGGVLRQYLWVHDDSIMKNLLEKRQKYLATRDFIFAGSLRLVNVAANFKMATERNAIDTIQEGMMGLLRAIEYFDPAQGSAFSTFAVTSIRHAMSRWVVSFGGIIDHGLVSINLSKTRKVLEESVHAVSNEELASAIDVSPDVAAALLVLAEGMSNRVNTIVDTASDFVSDLEAREQVEVVRMAMKHWQPRDAWILKAHYGLDGERAHTLEEIGQSLGITKQRVQQIVASRRRTLRSLLDSIPQSPSAKEV